MSCETCPHVETKSIPWIAFESMRASKDRTILRLCIIILVLIAVIVTGVVVYEIRESRYEDVYVEQEVDTGDGFAIVNGVGDIDYGKGETDSSDAP